MTVRLRLNLNTVPLLGEDLIRSTPVHEMTQTKLLFHGIKSIDWKVVEESVGRNVTHSSEKVVLIVLHPQIRVQSYRYNTVTVRILAALGFYQVITDHNGLSLP